MEPSELGPRDGAILSPNTATTPVGIIRVKPAQHNEIYHFPRPESPHMMNDLSSFTDIVADCAFVAKTAD
jgi:hypothetical protein